MRTFVVLLLLAMVYTASDAQAPACGGLGTAYLRTTLYFGLAHPTGTVTERQWQDFLRKEVTPRFPEGLTVWEANGQWRQSDGKIARERAKVLLLLHDDSAAVRGALAELVTGYKRAFAQESVLWETAPVCAAF
jgi:hypothetical protein